MTRRHSRRDVLIGGTAAAGSALLAGTVPAAAQAWPNRPITMIVPWGAGGGTDATARIIGTLLERDLKQPVNVVNRTGGSGVVGHSAIATAAPDGYTLGMITVEISMMHWQGLTELKPDSYTPLALMNEDPPGMQVASTVPYKTVKELADAIKAAPAGQAQGIRHRPGRHLASGAGRLADRHGSEAGPRAVGAVQRRRARHAGPGRRRHRYRHVLGARGARACSTPARRAASL